ncbi:MAG: cytochrome c [Wenzhouxiangellaceae bacterium]|nr:cytochrome c [Wenzhouxiangellaceae bacterium]
MKAIARFLKTTLILAVILIGGAIAYAYSGFYDIAVGTGHNPITHWYLETLREHSIERRAARLEVPPLADARMIRAGAIGYDQSCAGCHGRPGRPPSASFDPRPPALTRGKPDPAAAFWAIRNGIKMSAMPSRGKDRMSDDEAWQVVAFLQTASGLTEGEYRELVEPPPEPEPAEPEEPGDGNGEDPAQPDDAAQDDGASQQTEQQTEQPADSDA